MSTAPELYGPTVLVDMDGVLADFDARVVSILTAEYPEIPLLDTRQNFYISEDYPEHSALIKSISNRADFFASLPLVDGALDGWERMMKLGYRPQICSSPIRANPYSKDEKLAWLDQHLAPVFGKHVVDEAIISSNKHEYDGSALIDDRPQIKNADGATWQHVVYDRPYNQDTPTQDTDRLRLLGWHDQNLGAVLARAHSMYQLLGKSSL